MVEKTVAAVFAARILVTIKKPIRPIRAPLRMLALFRIGMISSSHECIGWIQTWHERRELRRS